MQVTRPRLWASVVLSFALALSACTSSDNNDKSDNGAATPGGTIVDLQNFAAGDPMHIDPALASDVQSSQIAALLYDGLTETTNDGETRESVAESASANDDATVWTFRIRDNVRFDNNDQVRPSDFKFAWERVADPKLESGVAYHLSNIKGFDEVAAGSQKELTGVVADDNARTLTVTLKSSFRDFDSLVSLPVFSPLPKKVFDANATATNSTTDLYTKWEEGVMVGNGPFRMANPWEKGKAITLARSDNYFGGASNRKANVDRVEFRVSDGLDAAFTDFESGNGQVGRIPPGRFQELQNSRPDDVVNTQLMGVEFWSFNMKSPTVGGPENLKFRQAVAAAIDKRDIVSKLYGNSRQVATSFSPPATPGYAQGSASPERNVERARTLLREWGKQPPALKITFNAGAGHEEKAAIIQQNLAEVGITATPEPLDNQSYRRAVGTGSADFFRQSWTADFASFDSMLAPNFSTANIGKDNVTNYSNPAFDNLINTARSESEGSKRATAYRDAEKLVMDDQVVVPLDWTSAGLIKADSVRGLQVSVLGHVDYAGAWVKR